MRIGTVIVVLLLVGGCIYWIDSPSSEGREAPPKEHPYSGSGTSHGYACTVDCGGHEAGYNWAEEHAITDGDDCDTAGEHSNSPSFAEGCHAYVDGDDSPSDDHTDGSTPESADDAE
jgi:hypothetical protein